MLTYYTSEKINDHMTAIRSMTGEILYLIEGTDRAVLIDTCLGVGNLRKFVETLTDKPITVLLTHGHVDHAMGAPEFDDVYMNHKDIEIYEKMRGVEERIGYIKTILGDHAPEIKNEDLVPSTKMEFKELKDGDCFYLGKVTIEVYALAGHTPGSMVMLVPEERLLILGDACNQATFLFDQDALTVKKYRQNLLTLQEKLEGRFRGVCLCHHVITASSNMMKSVIKVCDEILAGKADDIPYEFMGQQAYIAKSINEKFERMDGGEGNIIYDKSKII